MNGPGDRDASAGHHLGTRLRHLLELLDGDVEAIYREAGLTGYRPRYTPVMRALSEDIAREGKTIKAIACRAGSSHSAISQTVAQMARAGLVSVRAGRDARERVVGLTAAGRRLLPKLAALWNHTAAAANALDRELERPLGHAVEQAILALERRGFGERIRAERDARAPHAGARTRD